MTNLLTLPDAPAQRRMPAPIPRTPSVTRLIAGVRPQSRVAVRGMIWSAETVTVGNSLAYHLTLVDGSGELDVLFLGRPSVLGLQPGTRVAVEGTVGTYDGTLAMWNPRYLIEPAD